MAGFMAPGLGFASTVGAFIGGAARQANQNIEQQKIEDRDNDAIWSNRFERGLSEYKKETEKADQQSQTFKTLLQAAHNDQHKAEAAMQSVMYDPKSYKDVYNSLVHDTTPADTAYSSPFLHTLQANVDSRYKNLQQIYGSVRPQARQFMDMPQQGNPYDVSGSVGPQANAPQTAAPSGQPDQVISNPNSPQQPPTTQAADTSSYPTAATTATSPSPPAVPPQPAATTPVTAQEPFTLGAPNRASRQGMPPATPTNYADREAYRRALVAEGRAPQEAAEIAQGAITAKEAQDLKVQQYRLEHPNYGRTKLQDIYATALEKNIGGIKNDSELATDAGNAITMIQSGGLKTNATQPIFDMFNRVLSSMGANDLQKLDLANKVTDYNMLQKVITRMQFGQIPNYHLGRWTEREVAMLNSMIISGRTDENTNIKIALLIKNNAERSMLHTQGQAEAAGSGTPEELSKAMALRTQQLEQLTNAKQRLPWTDVDLNNPKDYEQWKQAPSGAWFNDIHSGRMAMKPYE